MSSRLSSHKLPFLIESIYEHLTLSAYLTSFFYSLADPEEVGLASLDSEVPETSQRRDVEVSLRGPYTYKELSTFLCEFPGSIF